MCMLSFIEITWWEEWDGLHQNIFLLMQVQLAQCAMEVHQGIQQMTLKTSCSRASRIMYRKKKNRQVSDLRKRPNWLYCICFSFYSKVTNCTLFLCNYKQAEPHTQVHVKNNWNSSTYTEEIVQDWIDFFISEYFINETIWHTIIV